MNKTYTEFTFRKTPYDVVFASMDGARRTPPLRYAVQRLRKWEPHLDDMLLVTAAHSIDVGAVLKPMEAIDPAEPLSSEYIFTNITDARKATVPRNLADDADSTLIGEAIDLSSKDKVSQPSRRLEEITESPTPLPAYYLLTHEGVLAAWWTVWDKSLEAGTAYPGLTYTQSTTTAPAASTPQAAPPASSPFGQVASNQGSLFANAKPASAFGAPSAPGGSGAFGKPAFGSPSTPGGLSGFGKPSTPGATPATGSAGGATFGAPGLGNKPSFGAPGFGSKPAFGAASNIGGQSVFGGPSQMNSKPNPFAAAAKSTAPNPFATGGSANKESSPFAAAAAGMKSGTTSPFSSFASNKTGQSAFGNLGSKPGLSSFGSTVTVDSKASGVGSTLPSLGNTPATQSGSLFGGGATSSFASFTSTQSGSTDLGDRGRDEATPTPQHPQLKQVTGVFDGKFKLGSTFQPDGSAKDDLPKPASSSGGSLFGTGFGSALGGIGGSSKTPATPDKSNGGGSSLFPSTTPATAPRPLGGLFSSNRAESTTPKPAPLKEPVIPEEAPLPPDWKPSKPSKTDDEIPPLAGSPPVNVEAPSSSADELPSSPLDDEEDGDLSNPDEQESEEGEDGEEEEGEDEEDYSEYDQSEEEGSEQSVPTESGRRSQESQSTGPRNFPTAPTPPQMAGRPQQPVRPLHPPHTTSTPMFGGTRRDPLSSSMPPAKPPTPQPIFSDLVDDEDARIREELDAEIEPSRVLAPFIARQEYSAPEAARTKTGHAAQIEIVYRDINSMIDTLGLNSRSVKGFIEWNERSERYTELDRSTLEEANESDDTWFEKWALCEIEDLIRIEEDLSSELDQGAIKGVARKLQDSIRVLSDSAKLLSRINDERRRIANAKDPERLDALRKAALPKDLADQQKALRRDYAQLLNQLCTAEEELNVLRSRLVAHNAQSGRTAGVPTVENIKKTITRLTELIIARNNDIALKDARLTKARNASSTSLVLRQSTVSTPRRGAASRSTAKFDASPANANGDDTPFATPQTSRSRMSLQDLNRVALTPEQNNTPSRGYGLFYAKRDGDDGGDLGALADRVDDGLEGLRETAGRRRDMAGRLVGVLGGRGVRRVGVR